jgi:catechol 2,3-dioxygenase-like lactoylglutathione lyase family enzyme
MGQAKRIGQVRPAGERMLSRRDQVLVRRPRSRRNGTGDDMDTLIAEMVSRFERGRMTRRQLVQGLSMLMASAASATGAAQTGPLRATGIDHVSVLVSDLQRSAAFYQNVFGMTQVSEDKPNQILRLGAKKTLVSLRHEGTPGLVDHFAISVENFNRDAVTKQLAGHGLTPQQNVEFGFHVKDPDGAVVQIV